MIVQEKIVESKHQKKQIAEVCTSVEFRLPFSIDRQSSLIEILSSGRTPRGEE